MFKVNWTHITPYSSVSIVNFEDVIAGWVIIQRKYTNLILNLGIFSCLSCPNESEFCEISTNTFFYTEHLRWLLLCVMQNLTKFSLQRKASFFEEN